MALSVFPSSIGTQQVFPSAIGAAPTVFPSRLLGLLAVFPSAISRGTTVFPSNILLPLAAQNVTVGYGAGCATATATFPSVPTGSTITATVTRWRDNAAVADPAVVVADNQASVTFATEGDGVFLVGITGTTPESDPVVDEDGNPVTAYVPVACVLETAVRRANDDYTQGLRGGKLPVETTLERLQARATGAHRACATGAIATADGVLQLGTDLSNAATPNP